MTSLPGAVADAVYDLAVALDNPRLGVTHLPVLLHPRVLPANLGIVTWEVRELCSLDERLVSWHLNGLVAAFS